MTPFYFKVDLPEVGPIVARRVEHCQDCARQFLVKFYRYVFLVREVQLQPACEADWLAFQAQLNAPPPPRYKNQQPGTKRGGGKRKH